MNEFSETKINYKLIKEDENFKYFETEFGVGFCASKHVCFDISYSLCDKIDQRDIIMEIQ